MCMCCGSDESAAKRRQPLGHSLVFKARVLLFFYKEKYFAAMICMNFVLLFQVVDRMGGGCRGIPAAEGVSHSLIPFAFSRTKDH